MPDAGSIATSHHCGSPQITRIDTDIHRTSHIAMLPVDHADRRRWSIAGRRCGCRPAGDETGLIGTPPSLPHQLKCPT